MYLISDLIEILNENPLEELNYQKADVGNTFSSSARAFLLRLLSSQSAIEKNNENESERSMDGADDCERTEGPEFDTEEKGFCLANTKASEFTHKVVQAKQASCNDFYDMKEFVGGGRFGNVYRCVEKKTALQLAAKCMKCKKSLPKVHTNQEKIKERTSSATSGLEPLTQEDILLEISIMNRVNHPNIVRLYDAYYDDQSAVLLFELLKGGELLDRIISDQSEITEFDAVLYIKQIVQAVEYLHKNSIFHLDLKPENILCINRNSHQIKIIDFGFARMFKTGHRLRVQSGTLYYMAPEVISESMATSGTDMWSIGIMTYMLLGNLHPFSGSDDCDLMKSIIKCEWDFDDPNFDKITNEGKDFVSKLLIKDPRKRATATQCLRHPWLSTPLVRERMKISIKTPEGIGSNWKTSLLLLQTFGWIKKKVFEIKKRFST